MVCLAARLQSDLLEGVQQNRYCSLLQSESPAKGVRMLPCSRNQGNSKLMASVDTEPCRWPHQIQNGDGARVATRSVKHRIILYLAIKCCVPYWTDTGRDLFCISINVQYTCLSHTHINTKSNNNDQNKTQGILRPAKLSQRDLRRKKATWSSQFI